MNNKRVFIAIIFCFATTMNVSADLGTWFASAKNSFRSIWAGHFQRPTKVQGIFIGVGALVIVGRLGWYYWNRNKQSGRPVRPVINKEVAFQSGDVFKIISDYPNSAKLKNNIGIVHIVYPDGRLATLVEILNNEKKSEKISYIFPNESGLKKLDLIPLKSFIGSPDLNIVKNFKVKFLTKEKPYIGVLKGISEVTWNAFITYHPSLGNIDSKLLVPVVDVWIISK